MYGKLDTKDSLHDKRSIEFPCPYNNGNIVTTTDCFDCCKSYRCDIYATMLDENPDD